MLIFQDGTSTTRSITNYVQSGHYSHNNAGTKTRQNEPLSGLEALYGK